LSRPPSNPEKEVGTDALRKFSEAWAKQVAAAGKPDRDAAGRKALATFCHAVVNSAGFLYVD